MKQFSRARIIIQGAVQGVGFRPFIFRLAQELKLKGWVMNSSQGVFIEAEADPLRLEDFLYRIQSEKPDPAFIQSFEATYLDAVGFSDFTIRESRESGETSVLVLPDIATCPACLREIGDPGNRRYRYPFTNCTLCGPRFSIIRALPYDRPQTTMAGFVMCSRCAAEYDNPGDRRFHAQPNACPDCGPQLKLLNPDGSEMALKEEALRLSVKTLKNGGTIALKGIGGFQLLVDASSPEAVNRLRQRKRRSEKPFAVMACSLELVKAVCQVSLQEEQLLLSPAAPIVILDRLEDSGSLTVVAEEVAPGNPTLGMMLPYSPLHHLLLSDFARAVVATSGNISEEPICIDETEALRHLGDIADLFLTHDRPIERYVDDSVVRLMNGREMLLRRARGFAPMPVRMPFARSGVLAVGAHQKNTVALQVQTNAFVSQHIGDLENEPSLRAFQDAVDSLCRLYDASPSIIVCDQHPDYESSRFAEASGREVQRIQHHFAHICACMAENELEGPALGIAWDGTGYGTDQTVWGGEILRIEGGRFDRVSFLRPFRLPGSEKAIREPRRSALGILYERWGDALFSKKEPLINGAFDSNEQTVMRRILQTGFNSPWTSSIGRLFDAVASLVLNQHAVSFEGQAAMALEFAMKRKHGDEAYGFEVAEQIDWAPMIEELLWDLDHGVTAGTMALKFHNGLAEAIVKIAHQVNLEKIVLSGGCFQNRYLTERTIKRLAMEGFRPYWHQRIPPNDGGISVGQLFAAGQA